MLVLGCAASPAHAGCGGTVHVSATHHLGLYRNPLIIGDSVLLGAMPATARAGFDVDAHGCRGFEEGLRRLRHYRHVHALPHLVVLQLGTDFGISTAEIREALSVVGQGRVLALMTPREAGCGCGGPDAANVRRAGRLYPDRVVVLDWVSYTSGRGTWFQPDGIHLTGAGAVGFAGYVKRLLPYAAPPRPPAGPPAPVPPTEPTP